MACVNRDHRDIYDEIYSPAYRFVGWRRRLVGKDRPPVRFFRFDIWGLLFDDLDGFITGATAWDPNVHPSWASAIRTAWNNIMQFLTPWYRPRRALLDVLINRNDMKLLSCDRKSAYLRTRDRDVKYLDVQCGWFGAKVSIIRFVDPDTGSGVRTFLCGLDETVKEVRHVTTGPCLTWGQCDRLYTRVVEKTPELGWEDNNKEDACG